MNKLLWTPDANRIQSANITRFADDVCARHSLALNSYSELHRWSVEHAEIFWDEVIKFTGIKFRHPPSEIVSNIERMPGAEWFPEATLNFAEHLLRHCAHSRVSDKPAIIFRSETGEERSLTFGALLEQVLHLAAALESWGVGPGDRVAAVLPNVPETIVAMLATASIGAIWSSCSPDFGNQGILDRFSQIEPKVLFFCDHYYYGGKDVDCISRLSGILSGLPTVQETVLVPYSPNSPRQISSVTTTLWNDYGTEVELKRANRVPFPAFPFNHPLLIMFSSGTTGKPKCIVHGAGGTLLQHLKELVLHTDVHPGDRLFYYTTCGWMMWNWMVSGLAAGATLLLFDGSPVSPNPTSLFDFADAHEMTIFGTSARYISTIQKLGANPQKTHQLSSLKTLLSTGSPLLPESFDYVYEHIKRDLCLSSISGGTDIVSCFALGNPTLPVYRGELQCPGLGMRLDVLDEQGVSLARGAGELVCTLPFPSMPIYFWNDPTGEMYRNAYFSIYPGVWRQGDFVEFTDSGGMIFSGRSDAVLNPGGVRFGTAELYAQVLKENVVEECVAVAQKWDADERVILFVKLRQGVLLSQEISHQIKTRIRKELSPKHVPAKIIQVPDIPRTVNGKVVELAIRDAIHGQAIKNVHTLTNPESLEFFKNLPELKL